MTFNLCHLRNLWINSEVLMIRRDFLKTSTLLGFGATIPTFLGRQPRGASGRQAGGEGHRSRRAVDWRNDGLNTVIPFKNETYYKIVRRSRPRTR